MEVIELNFCGLYYNLKINISQRGKKDALNNFIEAEDEDIDENEKENDGENDNNNDNENEDINIEMSSL